jgi:hypothetical protein
MRGQLLPPLICILLGVVLARPVLAAGQQTVRGTTYSSTAQVEGKTLRLLGAGLRRVRRFFLSFDAYTMAAYSESGTCDAAALISADETKYIHIVALRDLSADTIRGRLAEALENNTPNGASESLQLQIQTFLTYFEQDLVEQASMELIYVPGAGTTVKHNGAQEGAITLGKPFADILWSSYFSEDTCCTDLKEAILSSCSD